MAVHDRHQHVRDDEIDRRGADPGKALASVPRVEHLVPGALEHPAERRAACSQA
jgi:hypothetical protein